MNQEIQKLIDAWSDLPARVEPDNESDLVYLFGKLLPALVGAMPVIQQMNQETKIVINRDPSSDVELTAAIGMQMLIIETVPELVLANPPLPPPPSEVPKLPASAKLEAAKKASFGRRNPRIRVAE